MKKRSGVGLELMPNQAPQRRLKVQISSRLVVITALVAAFSAPLEEFGDVTNIRLVAVVTIEQSVLMCAGLQ